MKRLINRLRDQILKIRLHYFRMIGMDIDMSAKISMGAKIDITYPQGIHIGKETYIGGGSLILSHDFVRRIHTNTYIGNQCFIGMNSIILPGIKIGDNSIVGAGAVVTKDVPSQTIVAGNPAKVIKTCISTKRYGQMTQVE